MRKPEKKGTKVQIMTAREAVELIDDGDTLAVCGAGGGIVDPSSLIEALKDRYVETKEPKNLTLWHSSGLGGVRQRPADQRRAEPADSGVFQSGILLLLRCGRADHRQGQHRLYPSLLQIPLR